jgi:hypothetical protein
MLYENTHALCLMDVSKSLRKASDDLSGGFLWSSTEEGHAYWQSVDKYLTALSYQLAAQSERHNK